jgi:glycosyltransferase involved in cell wall biosynthesis
MAKRKKIAILFVFDYDKVTGVVIYLLNIIRTMKQLPDEQRPHIVIIYTPNSPIKDVEQIDYPYCTYYLYEHFYKRLNLLKRVVNKVARVLFKQNVFSISAFRTPFPNDIDSIYPYFPLKGCENIKRKIFWKADFQEKYYPQYFSQSELDAFNNFMKSISSQENVLVLSSNDAWNDFKKFYPENRNPVKLLRFASFLPDITTVRIEDLKRKYQITKPYFLIANQFWPHKNHSLVLKAIEKLKGRIDCLFVFTGKTTSYRDSNYFPMLETFIEEKGIGQYIKIAGFIDRIEQLQLMNNCIAVIQPSLFEGWSTVIEDAKALDKFVIASNLSVNLEQISVNSLFFDPADEDELAKHIESVLIEKPEIVRGSYVNNIEQFKKDIANVFEL